MIHNPALLDALSAHTPERFSGSVFRVTGGSADPLAPSTNGGRWAPGADGPRHVSVLYPSLDRGGAIAEVSSYLALLTPLPSRSLRVHRLEVSTGKTLRLAMVDLERLGVDPSCYEARNYTVTQQVGAALDFLDLDGLIASSARWTCDNLMIFMNNHGLHERLEAVGSAPIDWQAWARANGTL